MVNYILYYIFISNYLIFRLFINELLEIENDLILKNANKKIKIELF
jgi:hypothetical protein